MSIMKGQNFRILTLEPHTTKYKCVGMATNCTVTLTNNTEDATTKDDVGLASKPTVVSQAWSVQVESLSVADIAAILGYIKNHEAFVLVWDQTSTNDNQTPISEAYARTGSAYLNDATFNFNDRENSSKSLQFTGTGPIEPIESTLEYEAVSAGAYTKGQFIRLFLGDDNTTTPSKPIAGAKNLSLHTSLTMEDATTKDTDGTWQRQEPTALSYDISTSALIDSGDTITSGVSAQGFSNIETIYEGAVPVKWQIANVSGVNQRTKGSVIVSGSCIVTQLQANGPNRQNADFTAQLTGYGDYTIGA